MKIVKRDGRLCEFDQSKIKNAVLKAFVAVDGELTDYAIQKAENIAAHIESMQTEDRLTVEQIQDLVEKGLMSIRRKDVAKAYITYRHERTKEREKRGNTFNIIENRMDDSYCTIESVIRENKYMLEQCQKYSAKYVLIDDKYLLEEIMSGDILK